MSHLIVHQPKEKVWFKGEKWAKEDDLASKRRCILGTRERDLELCVRGEILSLGELGWGWVLV